MRKILSHLEQKHWKSSWAAWRFEINQGNFSGGKGQTTDLGEKAHSRSYVQITAAAGLPRS